METKRRHVDSWGSWDFHMEEDYESEKRYVISENWFGNSKMGVQGISYPSCYSDSSDKLFRTIDYVRCVSGTEDLDKFKIEYLEYVIKNRKTKYSKIETNNKYKIDFLIDNNYLYIEDDEIKFNFVLLNKSQHEKLNAYFFYHVELKNVMDVRNKMLKQLKEIVIKILPQYLKDDVEYLSSSYFYGYSRAYVIRSFNENGLIKPNESDKRFNFNMYAWTFSD